MTCLDVIEEKLDVPRWFSSQLIPCVPLFVLNTLAFVQIRSRFFINGLYFSYLPSEVHTGHLDQKEPTETTTEVRKSCILVSMAALGSIVPKLPCLRTNLTWRVTKSMKNGPHFDAAHAFFRRSICLQYARAGILTWVFAHARLHEEESTLRN